ncbi:MAG: S-adenosylmethionine synthetase N-terminal domain-containing protein, partial [Erysipelotrichaceae bacterium]|nr:S-adenosylmethionine synthetase N-terminal domain-containing protein [Erysipelotrichaceae bacterium]
MKTIFTSECVCSGHPDKVCDQISDAILDAILSEDKNAHVACETVASKNLLLITGEVGSNVVVDYEKIAREVIKEIGYDDPKWGFKYDEIEVKVAMSNQSSDINQG